MSYETHLTVRGFVGTVPSLNQSASGTVWTRFRVGSTPRRRSAEGTWVDGSTVWFSVSAFGDLAHRVCKTIRKGTPVLVHAKVVESSWTDQHGTARTQLALNASAVAVDLAGRGILTWSPAPDAGEHRSSDGWGGMADGAPASSGADAAYASDGPGADGPDGPAAGAASYAGPEAGGGNGVDGERMPVDVSGFEIVEEDEEVVVEPPF